MNRKEKAVALFAQGYNCSQAVAGAFDDVAGVAFETLMCLTAPLGGGVGRSGELCGAANGMAIVYGLVKGSFPFTDSEQKSAFAAEVCGMMDAFREKFHDVRCEDLLKRVEEGQEKHAYCAQLVAFAVDTLEKVL